MTIAISLDRIVDCVLAHSALDGLRNERPALLCRENSPALKRIALDSLAQIVAGLGINIKKTDIDLADPAKDDIVSFETDARQSDGRITLLRANIEANVVCAVLEQWHSLREMSAQTLPPPIKRAI